MRVAIATAGLLTLVQLRCAIVFVDAPQDVSLAVYDGTGTTGTARGGLLASSVASVSSGTYKTTEWILDTAINITAGQEIVLVWGEQRAPVGGEFRFPQYSGTLGYNNLSISGWWSSSGAAQSGKPYLRLLSRNDTPKGVIGPLDPVDFPRSTPTDASKSSGFMVVNDAAKTASLYWKFSDGSTKKLDLA